MSFKNQDFSVIAYANGFTLWNYQTVDTLTSAKAVNYFNDVATFARKGDMILTITNSGSTPVPAILMISSIENGVVTVVDFTTKI